MVLGEQSSSGLGFWPVVASMVGQLFSGGQQQGGGVTSFEAQLAAQERAEGQRMTFMVIGGFAAAAIVGVIVYSMLKKKKVKR